MNFIKNNLANAFTLGNLFSGCIGIIELLKGNYEITAICIIISLVLDFFDGFVARAMKSNSNLGVQLDSLADMVSFGFLPGVAMYSMLETATSSGLGEFFPWIKYLGLLITVFSCLRLAIFNIDDEQTYYFKGLNTPTNTVFIFGICYLMFNEIHSQSLQNPFGQLSISFKFGSEILIILTLLSSWLLVSPIKMIAMKFKSMKWQDNIPKIVLLIGGILILIFFKIIGIPLLVVYYILVSLIFQKKLQ